MAAKERKGRKAGPRPRPCPHAGGPAVGLTAAGQPACRSSGSGVFANRRLADTPERPGWMDLGPKHDLRALTTGRQWFAGVPFDLLPDSGPQCVMLASAEDAEGLLPVDAWQIPVSAQAEALVFLQTGSRLERFARHIHDRAKVNPGPIGTYAIHCTEGDTKEVPLEWNVTLADWNSQLGSAFGRTAWTGATVGGAPLHLEALTWGTPHPEKPVAAIDVVAARSTVRPVLLAVTAAVPARLRRGARGQAGPGGGAVGSAA